MTGYVKQGTRFEADLRMEGPYNWEPLCWVWESRMATGILTIIRGSRNIIDP